MFRLIQFIAIIWIIQFIVITVIGTDKGTIVIFGGNGFVGRRICEEAIARSYGVISISRSGCPKEWQSSEWAKKVEWYKADALKIDTYKDYIRKQNPIAVFTMMGTATFKQIYKSVEEIFEYAGTTNINVCNVASKIKSVEKFVYIGAPVTEIGVNPSNENNSYALWTQLWIGQYNAKLAVEKCVDEKFGNNGLILRPNAMDGVVKKEIFGKLIEFNQIPFYESSKQMRKFYKFILPSLMSVNDLSNDALDFIESSDINNIKCVSHSKKQIVQPSGMIKIIMDNVDNIILAIISLMTICVVYLIIKYCSI